MNKQLEATLKRLQDLCQRNTFGADKRFPHSDRLGKVYQKCLYIIIVDAY